MRAKVSSSRRDDVKSDKEAKPAIGIDRDIGIDHICVWPIAESAVRDTEATVRVIFRKDVGQSENPEEFRMLPKWLPSQDSNLG